MQLPTKRIAILRSAFTDWLVDSDSLFFNNVCVLFEYNELENPQDYTLDASDFKHVEKVLEQWNPVFMRRIASWNKHETIRKLLCFQILIWKCRLQKFNCEIAVFETAASHHIETLCFEIACDLIGIKKVFLSHTAFTGRLLPIQQSGPYTNRKLLNIELTDWLMDENVLDLDSKFWSSRTSLKFKNETWTVCFFMLLIKKVITLKVKRVFFLGRKIRQRYTKKNIINTWDSVLTESFGYKVIDEYRIHRDQVLALKQLKLSNQFSERILAKNISTVETRETFVLYASFQPESSSFPLGGNYCSHIDIVLKIREKFPKAPIVYIEHPHITRLIVRGSGARVGLARSVEYYKLLELLGCNVLSAKSESASKFKSFVNATHITISGNIAIERALRGQVTVVAGNPWFKGMPGTLYFEDFLSGSSANNSNEANIKELSYKWILSAHNKKTLSQPHWSIFNRKVDEIMEYYIDLKKLIFKLSSD